ncbi:MAG: phytoene desaturase family protein [Ilumatobacteraceae bacterium]
MSSFITSGHAVIVGGGHNGAICAAYLARAGRQVTLIEARSSLGGCASTEEDLGARFNICNCDHTMVRALPLIDELELDRHGLSYVEPEFSMVCAFHDDTRPWLFHHDVDRHLETMACTHPHWVDAYRRYLNDALPVARLLIDIVREQPSVGLVSTVARLRGRGARRLLAWSKASARSVLESYFNDWHLWMPAVATGPTVWGVPPEMPGTGLAAAGYATRHLIRMGRPIGGSGRLVDAVEASLVAAGGRVILGRKVSQLMLEGGSVAGVVLDDGTQVTCDLVVAACDPQRVFSDWLDEVPESARAQVTDWRNRSEVDGYESKLDMVVSQLPEMRWHRELVDVIGDVDDLGPTTVVSPSPSELAEAHRLRRSGDVAANPTLLFNVPTVIDPAMQVNQGEHVLSLEVLFTPFNHSWSESAEPSRWLDVLKGLCVPGTLNVDRWRAMTPDVYEREFLMHRGHTPAFSGAPLHTLVGRPKELTRYRTEIDGLFLSGAAAFPGAGVFGGAGRNAARAVLSS